MDVITKLATSLDRKDEIPNQELARDLVAKQDKDGIRQLVALLSHTDKRIQSDCIKVLYEIGAIAPELIADHGPDFLKLLKSKNNRLQWGGMAALDAMTASNPAFIYDALTAIIDAAEKGSVITKDHTVNILVQLCAIPLYAEDTFALLMEQLLRSPVNQLPMYAERSLPIIRTDFRKQFLGVLETRLPDVEKASKRKRLERVMHAVKG